MLIFSNTGHQTNLFGTDLLQQLDPNDPLLRLASVIPGPELDRKRSTAPSNQTRQKTLSSTYTTKPA